MEPIRAGSLLILFPALSLVPVHRRRSGIVSSDRRGEPGVTGEEPKQGAGVRLPEGLVC